MQQENTGAQRPQEEEYLFQLAKLEVRIRAMSAQEKEKYADKIAEVQKHLRALRRQRQAVAGHMARMQGAQAQPPRAGPGPAACAGRNACPKPGGGHAQRGAHGKAGRRAPPRPGPGNGKRKRKKRTCP